MKIKFFLLATLFPFIFFGQQLEYSQLEKFPNFNLGFSSGLPLPIQFNRTNVFGPTVNLECQVKGYAVTNYNCAVYTSIGPGVITPVIDTLEQTVFYPNYWMSSSNMMYGFALCGADFNFSDNGNIESYLFYGMCPETSSEFSYDENNLIESFQSTEGTGVSYQQHNFDFAWSDNNQRCEVIKNNTVISSFQSDSLGNSTFQFDSLGKLINYYNISDYSTFNSGGPGQLNNGYVRVDTINFQYDVNGKISNAHMKQYYNYLSGSSNPDSLIIYNSNVIDMNLDYHWVEEFKVELTFDVIGDNDQNPNLFDTFDGSNCLNEQLVSKIIYDVDSSQYITSAMHLDSNFTTFNSYVYHFCDEDTVLYGCQDITACNYDSVANYTGSVLGLSPSSQGPCIYTQDYVDCDGNCYFDSDEDGVCDELESSGCQDETACNYHNLAGTEDDGSCIYPEIYYDCSGVCINDADNDLVCDELEVPGCIDESACNYNSEATDEGDCNYPEMYYDCQGNCINDIDNDEECDEVDYDDGIGIDEISEDTPTLIKMIDVLGREQKEHKIGTLLFYIYDNGKVEKNIIH